MAAYFVNSLSYTVRELSWSRRKRQAEHIVRVKGSAYSKNLAAARPGEEAGRRRGIVGA